MAPRTRQREGREDMAYVAVECARDGDGTRHRRLDGDASRPQALKTTPLFSTSGAAMDRISQTRLLPLQDHYRY